MSCSYFSRFSHDLLPHNHKHIHVYENSKIMCCRQWIPHKGLMMGTTGTSKASQLSMCTSAALQAHNEVPTQRCDALYYCSEDRPAWLQASGNLPQGSPNDLGLRLRALQAAHQPLVDLFNQYAVPYHQWELCLELVHASDGVDMAYVKQLWDLYLKQVSLMLCFISCSVM